MFLYIGITTLLLYSSRKIRKDKIRNERFRGHLGLVLIGDKIRETRLRWFGHIQHRLATMWLRKSLAMQVDGLPTGRGGPTRT